MTDPLDRSEPMTAAERFNARLVQSELRLIQQKQERWEWTHKQGRHAPGKEPA
jgi:hypothetical protein